jgi:hypothetical protein
MSKPSPSSSTSERHRIRLEGKAQERRSSPVRDGRCWRCLLADAEECGLHLAGSRRSSPVTMSETRTAERLQAAFGVPAQAGQQAKIVEN